MKIDMVAIDKKQFAFGDMVAVFATIENITQFLLVPKGYENALVDEKLAGVSPLGCRIDNEPMMHIALSGDGYARDFTSGTTLRNSDTAFALRLVSQELSETDEAVTLVSRFENGKGLIARQHLRLLRGRAALEAYNELENTGEAVTVETFPSFNLSCISPFSRFHDPGKMVLHKLLSNWSGEGKLYSVTTDRLAFEPSWSGLGIRTEKWSQTGTMPARGQLPFVALEDLSQGVCWAVAMEAPASWVIETVFRNGNLSVGGGMGDHLTAHWRKVLGRGETMRTDKAFLTVVHGGLNCACDRLVKAYDNPQECKSSEYDLPILYNEYCYSWTDPHLDELRKMIPVAKRLGCKYFVMDDGWFCDTYGSATHVIGDWDCDETVFPEGMRRFSDELRESGMALGLWFEFEGVSTQSRVFREHPEYMLTYDGKIIDHRGRAFLDFRKPEVHEYLREKVIRLLAENNVGYMKVDYNENVGLGADGAESYGEALRCHMQGVLEFYREIKRELPDLVLEICSSGGMRHEPGFLGLADMVSFSDAHENAAGVNVACNLHRFIPPRKLQIWATIRDDYTAEDVCFTVAKAMLGRYCLSGNLAGRSEEITAALEQASAFYHSVVPIIRDGVTTVIEDGDIGSYLNGHGRTWLIRESADGREKLVYAYAIEAPGAAFSVEVGDFRVKDAYHAPADLDLDGGRLTFTSGRCPMWGCVIRLEKREGGA